MPPREIWPGLFWLVLGAVVSWVAHGYQVGEMKNPGAGFLPFYLGLIMSLCALPVIAGAVKAWRQGDTVEASPCEVSLGKVVPAVACLIAFGLAVERLGFPITAAGFLLCLFRLAGGFTIKGIIVSALLSSAACWFLFVYLLKCDLPVGVLGLG